jgi:hypothetical protein
MHAAARRPNEGIRPPATFLSLSLSLSLPYLLPLPRPLFLSPERPKKLPRCRHLIFSAAASQSSLPVCGALRRSPGMAGFLPMELRIPKPLARVRPLRPPLPASMALPSSFPRPPRPRLRPPGEQPVLRHFFLCPHASRSITPVRSPAIGRRWPTAVWSLWPGQAFDPVDHASMPLWCGPLGPHVSGGGSVRPQYKKIPAPVFISRNISEINWNL